MLPVESTAREATWAMAASAFVALELSGSQPLSVAMVATPGPTPLGVQLLSISPGWMIESPTLAWSLRAST